MRHKLRTVFQHLPADPAGTLVGDTGSNLVLGLELRSLRAEKGNSNEWDIWFRKNCF